MAKLKWVDGRTESKNCAESLRIHPCFQSSFNWTKAKIIQLSMTTNSKETMVHNYSVYVILSPSLTVAVEQAYWKECWTKFTMRSVCPFKLEKRQSLNSIINISPNIWRPVTIALHWKRNSKKSLLHLIQ